MSQPPSITLLVPEGTESDGQEPSPDNERALHTSFHQLILEQSSLIEAGLELQERARESPACLATPEACAMAWPEPGQGEEHPSYSSPSLQILASMPSRTIGRNLGAIISQYCNRTARLRRRSGRPPLQQLCRAARPSLRHYDLDTDPSRATLEEKRRLLVKELLSLSPSQCSHMLLTMPLSLVEKRILRRQLSGQRGPLRQRAHHWAPFSPCGWSKVFVSLGCRGLWYRLLSLLRAAQPGHYALKQIGGRFGSSVLSYFLFLKTLLMLNFFSFFILLAFVVVLQAVYPTASVSPQPFSGLELLTGAGYFTHSLLYYGYYSNVTLNDPCTSSPEGSVCPLPAPLLPYNLPLAYLFSVGVSFLVTCILLVYSVSRSFRESVGSSTGALAIKVFCAWDFKVIQRRSVKLQCENICTQLKELLGEQRSRSRAQGRCQCLGHCLVVLLAWLLALGSVLGCVLAVHYFSEHMHVVQQEQQAQGSGSWKQEAILLVLPLVVSLLNALMPHLFNLLAMWERQDSPVTEVYVAIIRNLILKMVILSLLCYHWLSRSIICSTEECWETCVGQDLYRFVVMDFIFTLLDTLFGELIWRLILEKRLKTKQRPEFDIARNVLELIYGQTLTWLGILFAPLLPAVQMLKLLLLFYIKKTSLMRNCQSPSKPWQASHMTTVFITLLCFPSFLGAAAFLSYTIWSVQPSETCGPFRGLETIYKSGKRWVLVLEKSNPNITWFAWVYQHLLENTCLLFFMSVALIAVIYFNIQVVRGRQRVICLLQEQIANEGEDKVFLIQKLHSVYEQRHRHS
ncbi:transmembrane channel-like protein 6 [Onychostruthus taczanowskii]|uniref:transmembrane channel-like protein 6 n=1 Tax=Onychostruthus taczanowskii TaxID=356909 RepID=UPI001B80E7AB|nr:transmembrane channel-like protein 6 [Onychostruthus taczanowskii]XP_041265164.1 transmembrane channel-like protein 6 [Onychostruthus taczanowskii]XP_041265165.1 transmembrane channel-like protein 6 [Onychostruthus taczanowskii]XP_041265166.1 transmembrane channel-like protein 6 [Onychostruthus taczanowskii]XP_041265167.1 transmembrane channel-like protein 6 [Onychostruthus taczanowskii]